MRLYHATDRKNLASIRAEGLRPNSCWSAWEKMAGYYAETIADEGGDPVILEIEAADIGPETFRPDREGIAEPIMTVIRSLADAKDEDDVHRLFSQSDGSWEASLRICGSCRCGNRIPPENIVFPDPPAPRLRAP